MMEIWEFICDLLCNSVKPSSKVRFFNFFSITTMEGLSNFISLRGIKKIYAGNGADPVYALRGVDLDIHD